MRGGVGAETGTGSGMFVEFSKEPPSGPCVGYDRYDILGDHGALEVLEAQVD